jgi:hypothetical protein
MADHSGIPTTGMFAPWQQGSQMSEVHYWLIPTGNGKIPNMPARSPMK